MNVCIGWKIPYLFLFIFIYNRGVTNFSYTASGEVLEDLYEELWGFFWRARKPVCIQASGLDPDLHSTNRFDPHHNSQPP